MPRQLKATVHGPAGARTHPKAPWEAGQQPGEQQHPAASACPVGSQTAIMSGPPSLCAPVAHPSTLPALDPSLLLAGSANGAQASLRLSRDGRLCGLAQPHKRTPLDGLRHLPSRNATAASAIRHRGLPRAGVTRPRRLEWLSIAMVPHLTETVRVVRQAARAALLAPAARRLRSLGNFIWGPLPGVRQAVGLLGWAAGRPHSPLEAGAQKSLPKNESLEHKQQKESRSNNTE